MTVEGIPHELKTRGLFCLWRYEERDGKKTKVPYKTDGRRAASNKPETFTAFDKALAVYRKGGYNGLGLGVFNGFCAVDIDHCIDNNAPGGSALSAMAQDIIETMDSYTELSPSGTGIRILFRAEGFRYDKSRFYVNNQARGLEVYIEGSTNKYVTVTGMHCGKWGQKPIAERGAQIAQVLEKYMRREKKAKQPDASPSSTAAPVPLLDFELLEKIRYSKHGEKFVPLWDGDTSGYKSASEADIALCNILAFWTRKDAARMDSLFRQSGLMRDKWDRPQSGSTYGALTIQRAIEDCTAVYDPQAAMGRRALAAFSSLPGGEALQDIKPADYSDAGNAAVFSRVFAGKLLYADSLGWLWWDGRKWDRSDHHATRCALDLSEAMYRDALNQYTAAAHTAAQADIDFANEAIGKTERDKAKAAEANAKAYFKHASSSRNASRINGFISLSIPSFLIKADRLDANPFDLNTPAGIVDLRSGGVRPHDPEAYCTQITACPPGTAGAGMWSQFLDWVTGGDPDLCAYLQMVAGMAAVGEVFQEGIVMAYGPGGNGKSTLVNSIGNVLGEYTGSIAIKILTTERQNSGPALATLRGKRLVVAGELEENQRLSVSTLKQLASTDKLVIEEKYHSPEEVKQTHTLILFTNHLPRVGSTDGGTWRRLTVVPFLSKVAPDKSILNYTETLTREAGEAILSWVVHGAVKFCANEFKIPLPAVVAEATREYQAREDWLSNFLAERCTRDPNGRVQSSELYAAYREWSQGTGDYTRRLNDFSTAMEAAGFVKIAPKNIKHWQGLILNPVPLPEYGYSGSRYSS